MIIDAQVHAYERNHPGRPWAGELPGPPEVTGEQLTEEMDAVGVGAALLVSVFTAYGFDPSYIVAVHESNPDRFALITPVDSRRDDAVEVINEWAGTKGAVGLRLMTSSSLEVDEPGVKRVMEAAAAVALPLCVSCAGRVSMVDQLAAAYPDNQVVIDHLGLHQPMKPPVPADPFADLPSVLTLARHPNVAVKLTRVVSLSHDRFPFEDLWEPLGRVFDAFGLDRCMWGSDWTSNTALISYANAVTAFRDSGRLSDSEQTALMSGTLQRVFGWTPGA